jgi:hypothetical protein
LSPIDIPYDNAYTPLFIPEVIAMSDSESSILQGTLDLVQKKWIGAKWGVSDNNRKVKFYSLTNAGRKQLQAETANWERVAGVMGRVLYPQTES